MRSPRKKVNLALSEVWSLYIKSITLANYSKDTIERKISHFDLLLKALPDGILARDVDQSLIDDFILFKQKNVKPASLNSYLRVYRAFFNWAYKYNYIDEKLIFPTQKEQKEAPKSYTTKELELLLKKPNLKTCSFNEYRDWVIINFIMGTGARRTTIVALNIEDLKVDEGYIEFNRTKNKNAQLMPLTPVLRDILLEYLDYRNGSSSEPLFCLNTGERMKKEYLTKEIAKYNRRRGVKKTSLHAYRHTFARSAVLDCHMNVFQLQRMLGHADLKTTEKYVRLFDKDVLFDAMEHNPLNFYQQTKKDKIRIR